MPLTVDDLITLYQQRGGAWYGGETVTQREHALQCAWLAEQAGSPPGLIIACLLHDLGHLLHEVDDDAARRVRADAHELHAASELAHLFPPAVLAPIRLHVTAKRHLCGAEPRYWATLSAASRRSLALQGGPLTQGQSAAFMSMPGSADALSLRRWDDAAQVAGTPTPDLEQYRPMMQRLSFRTARHLVAQR